MYKGSRGGKRKDESRIFKERGQKWATGVRGRLGEGIEYEGGKG